jgi:hypothetical protein
MYTENTSLFQNPGSFNIVTLHNTKRHINFRDFHHEWFTQFLKSPKKPYMFLSSSILILWEFIHMSTLFPWSAMEYVCLSIRHISCQYASVSVVTTTQVTSPVAYYRPDSTSWCIVIREPAYQWLMARGMCIICIYAVSISLGHIL